jgi:uncharacterized protein YjbI with pentapeptide repeats
MGAAGGFLQEARLIQPKPPERGQTAPLAGGQTLPTARVPLFDADLTGADLRGADLRGVDLRAASGLAQKQLDTAIRDKATKLPEYLSGKQSG